MTKKVPEVEFHLGKATSALVEAGKAGSLAFTSYLTLVASATLIIFFAEGASIKTPLGEFRRFIAAEVLLVLGLMAAHKSIALGVSARLLVFKIKSYLRATDKVGSTWDIRYPSVFFVQNIVMSRLPGGNPLIRWPVGLMYFYLFLVHPVLLLDALYDRLSFVEWFPAALIAIATIGVSIATMVIVPSGSDEARISNLVKSIEARENAK